MSLVVAHRKCISRRSLEPRDRRRARSRTSRKRSSRAATPPKPAERSAPRCGSAKRAATSGWSPWLDSLRADAVFGWRQLKKNKVTSAAAILSLALAIGACTSAFRLIDALLLRPLPVADAERLYALARQGIGFDGKLQTLRRLGISGVPARCAPR